MMIYFLFFIEFCDQMKINMLLLYNEVMLHNKTPSLSNFFLLKNGKLQFCFLVHLDFEALGKFCSDII